MVEVTRRNVSERLYLLKEDANELFVNDCQLLKRHQINGLRFLFVQFKKKKPGVIINFPSGCGKSVTVVLFLYAVKDLLTKPMLILCDRESEMYTWKEYFLKWTELNGDDIVVGSNKVLKGKKIFIQKINELGSYQKHSWSVVVVKDDIINKEVSLITNAEFKIWITSTDMKKDLTMLAFIYNWLYPKLNMDINEFKPSSNIPREIYKKSIYLDAFLEDFVIREDDIKKIDTTMQSKISLSYAVTNKDESKSKKTRKKKDAVGNKIKRSRRVIDDDKMDDSEVTTDNINVENNNFAEDGNIPNASVLNDKVNDNKTEGINNDVQLNDKNINDSLERQDADQNKTEEVASDINMEVDETEQLSFGNAVNEIVKNENTKTENSTESIDFEDMKVDRENIDENNDKKVQENLNTDNIEEQKCMDVDENSKVITEIVKDEKCMEVENSNANIVKTDEPVERHKTIDTKLSELEERLLKKFKGSYFDRMF